MKRMLICALFLLFGCKEPPPAPPAPPDPPEQAASRPADVPATQPDEAKLHAPSEKNNQIAYKDERCGGVQPCDCSGTIMYGQNAIAKIGITEEDLARGTPCLLGDFDGNGHQDAAFFSKDYGTAPAASVQVLLFDDLGLRDTPIFPKKVSSLTVHTRDGKVGLLEASSRLFFVYQDGKFEMERI